MFNHKYVSLNQVIDRIKRGKFYKELPLESAIDYAVEAYRLLASEKAEITLPAKLKVESYKTKIPSNLERIIQAVKVDECMGYMQAMRYATDNFNSLNEFVKPFRQGYDENNISIEKRHDDNYGDYTYTMNNNYIITSFEEGWIFLAYKGLPEDENGMLRIPDNVNVLLAIEYYVKYRYLDDMGSSNPRMQAQQNSDEQQYCWYIGKAQDHMTALSMDEYESFANSMSKFFDTEDYHRRFLKNLGGQEFITNQRYG